MQGGTTRATVWLLRYSELFLKSDYVRREWERALLSNIREILPGARARRERGRIWLTGRVEPERLKRIFGIVSCSEVERVDLEELESAILDYCRRHGFGEAKTFAVRVKRVGEHGFTSMELAAKAGELIKQEFPVLSVDLGAPEKVLYIEVRGADAYLYDRIERCAGGLPLGVEGSLVALVSGGIDSPVAAWMMMRRGCRILPLYILFEPFFDPLETERAKRAVEALRRYQPGIELTVVDDPCLAEIAGELRAMRMERYTCILCKRRMYRLASEYAEKTGAKGIVTGESLGQVASQTLDNLMVLEEAARVPVYRPLIGMDKEEIVRIAREIGTWEAQEHARKGAGCRAVPRRPATAAKLEMIREIEEILCRKETGAQGRS